MQRNMYLEKAVELVRELYAVEHGPNDHINAERDAADAVTTAVTAQRFTITHRQIASLAGVPGLLVVRLIRDDNARAIAFQVERHAAERYLDSVRSAMQSEALRRHARGDEKQVIATVLGITRPTLDAWLKEAVAELVEAVKQYAKDHYTDGGWDVVAETYDDSAIAQRIIDAKATSTEEALAAFEPLVDVWSDRQADARNSAF